MEFTSQNFEKQSFQNITCVGQDLSRKEFSSCTFVKCDLSGSKFTGTVFSGCVFRDCNLSNVKVSNSSFQGVRFEGCKLLGVLFSEVNALLVDWTFDKCSIALCDFGHLPMKGGKFIACEIRETDFAGADLAQSDFSGCDLTNSTFQNTDLERANFVGARNYYIDPTSNKLKGAHFATPDVLSLLSGFGIEVEY